MKMFEEILNFLGKAFGDNCEVVLQDTRKDLMCIRAIANSHISGRKVGSPLTDLALRFINDEIWKTRDCVSNYIGKTRDGKTLRSSTFFIKRDGELLGMLCINIDASKYLDLSKQVLRLIGMEAWGSSATDPLPQSENFYESMEEIIQSVLTEMNIDSRKQGQLTQVERLAVVEKLLDKGVFILRGAVSTIAEKLSCSEASMYRYIGTINKRRNNGDSEAK
ncbi:MAG: PAS domain-containing protein [Clostridiales bacterium]|nr:PAS domain-containing protein [Clostridiales bacterium]